MIRTKYGAKIREETMAQYFERLVGRIFKLLGMHEKDRDYEKYFANTYETLDSCLSSLLSEVAGGNKLILEDVYFIQLLNNLENLQDIKTEYKKYRSQVFHCIGICKKIIENLEKGGS